MKSKNCIENRKIILDYPVAEKLSDENCDERLSEVKENRVLLAVSKLLHIIDSRDGKMNNDPMLNHTKKLTNIGIKENSFQYHKNLNQQKIFDEVIKI